MALNRRDLFKGFGAFVGAASAYTATGAGVLLPYDKIITAPVSHWDNYNMVTAFEGVATSLTISQPLDEFLTSAFSVRPFVPPVTTPIDVGMEFVGVVPGDIFHRDRLFVQIFYNA